MPGPSIGTTTRSTRENLVVTAERLFAHHGIEGVSIRQILQAAGVANNSAVQYHFESKTGLVRAIFDHRVPYLAERRRLLWAQATPGDLRSGVEAHFLPVAELAELEDSHYMTFLEQLELRPSGEHPFHLLPEDIRRRYREYEEQIGALVPDVPDPVRRRRLLHASSLCLHACAERERSRQRGADQIPLALHVNELLDLLIGVLTAEVSLQTRAALSNPRNDRWAASEPSPS
ncbi:MAG TPA: TetR/AcrR family transcriptional regulator [Acidimicrobiales bacterium]|jgi:AcrR family transcriptional regulator|nr:TetR/AcrR family transcriptional regulator [Acidimicrobiales bacterium]